METVFILGFVLIFIVLLSFVIVNTLMGSYIIPVFNDIVKTTPMINETEYMKQVNILNTYFNYAMYILLVIPFLFILVYVLLKREVTPKYYGA